MRLWVSVGVFSFYDLCFRCMSCYGSLHALNDNTLGRAFVHTRIPIAYTYITLGVLVPSTDRRARPCHFMKFILNGSGFD